VVNNLPVVERWKHVLLHSLRYGVGKPNKNSLLKPLVDELMVLHDDGFVWTLSPGVVVKSRVNLDLIVADSVARPLQKNFKQFNGTISMFLLLIVVLYTSLFQ